MAPIGILDATRLAGEASGVAWAELRDLGGRQVSWFEVSGGSRAGAIGVDEGSVVERAVRAALDLGVPLVGLLATSGADVSQGVASLHAWGRVARAVAEASGTVPVVLAVTGPCVSGPALLLGLADHVVMTDDAFAYVSGPEAAFDTTGVVTDHELLGGGAVHGHHTGVASLVVPGIDDVADAVADLLSFLPQNTLDAPPLLPTDDPADRRCERAGAVVPERTRAAYDVRDVVGDVLDEGTLLEVRAGWAPNMVTAYGSVAGRPVGIVANQPCRRAGTLDIAAAVKAARFVSACDAFNVPLLTFVDTPGFEPGKDLEWRGMIRHGAKLAFAYAEATVPRVSVVLRKAYGGAYIVMDSKGLGNDYCVAWPRAEIAVMGAPGAVQVLHGRRLRAIDDPDELAAEQARLEDEYAEHHLNPWRAAARGYVDVVCDPTETRGVVAAALGRFASKREMAPRRRHSNTPL